MVNDDGCQFSSLEEVLTTEVDSVPSLSDIQTVPLSPSAMVSGDFDSMFDLEDELLGPSFEVSSSLSVCGNIHQAQYFPFWDEVLKCGPWHKKILKEGLRLDFIDDELPGPYEERNNRSARLVCFRL